MQTAIPAATLIVFRRGAHPVELLFVERAGSMTFAAGAIVFPGGRVDPGDRMMAAQGFPHLDLDDAAARIAAIRETIEEAGVVIGLRTAGGGAINAEMARRLQAHLHEGQVFADILGAHQLEIMPEALQPFARWRPNFSERRIFDARFYLAELPRGAPMALVDATENVRLFWASAQQVLDDARAGLVKIIFPTRRNLERLAQFADFETARADAQHYAPDLITPWVEDRDGAPHLCIPEDRGYPICAEPMVDVLRG
ncbi:NUDIX domain-containing protein [Sphingomonas sp.]|uniref:NUDIX domain-containing protein n=1 Tax=Sphingomonas sp. TaxID=28214 RepID=UPI0025E25705|nr:NUDIX domain-containing protein [Sphingomonas sp.]